MKHWTQPSGKPLQMRSNAYGRKNSLAALHRVRERWVMRQTAVVNQIRGLLLERGITLSRGRRHVDTALPAIIEDAELRISGALRMLLFQLKMGLDQ
jgi:transposase